MASSELQAPGQILTEFEDLLGDLRSTYADKPLEEYRHLAMLALEREQLVSYAYRKDVLGARLSQLTIPTDMIDVLSHAFTQVWRDEEAHTVLIRGKLLTQDRPVGLARASVEQAAGWLAGWSASLKHHVPRSAAPLRNFLVDGLAQGARFVGKLSPELRAELKLKSFRDYCLYNVDAEETAELCWRRLVELEKELDGPNAPIFERIAVEERQHREVFALVASILDRHDWLKAGVTTDALSDQLYAIGPRFSVMSGAALVQRQKNRGFGQGGAVHVFDQGSHSRDQAFGAALDQLGSVANKKVVIKTSWMMGYSRDDPSSIIDPATLNAIVDELIRRGAEPTVIDGPNLYSRIYSGRSVLQVAHHFGIEPCCKVADALEETVTIENAPMLGPTEISKVWLEADLRISLVRLRSHPRDHLHGVVSNLEDLILDWDGNVFWQRSYDHSIAALTAAIVAPPDLGIIDAWSDCPDGLFGIMAGRHVVHPGRVYASVDAMACDLIAMRHSGSARTVKGSTLRRCIEWFGDSRLSINVVGNDDDIDGWKNPHDSFLSGLMADLSYPVFAYLSRSGALFAPPMDDEFRELKRLPVSLRAVRHVARQLLGLRPPAR